MFDEQYINENLSIIAAIVIWELAWKAIALWKAAKNDSKSWFIALLIINTVGLLPIFYIFIFSKQQPQKSTS